MRSLSLFFFCLWTLVWLLFSLSFTTLRFATGGYLSDTNDAVNKGKWIFVQISAFSSLPEYMVILHLICQETAWKFLFEIAVYLIHDSSSLHHYCVFFSGKWVLSILHSWPMTLVSMPCRYFLHSGRCSPVSWLCHCFYLFALISCSGGEFWPKMASRGWAGSVEKCNGQAVCWMLNTYAFREAGTLKKLRKQEDLRENRGWWKSGTLVRLHTRFCCLGEWPATVT